MRVQNSTAVPAIHALPAGLPLQIFTILALLMQTMGIITPFAVQTTI
jgi:hypothetical protein